MEWIWYIIAALGAGIGTGLAGLSAATVMVPILIVLCPSFAGETGRAAIAAFPAAITGAATELFSPSEWDTVTVPVVILIVLMLAMNLVFL